MNILKSIQAANSFVLDAPKFFNTRRILMLINKKPVPNALMTNQLQRGINVTSAISHMPTRGICRLTLNESTHCSDRYICHSDCSSHHSDRFIHRSNHRPSTVFAVFTVFGHTLSLFPGCLFVIICISFYLYVPCSIV